MDLKQLYPNPHGDQCFWYEAAEKLGAPNVKWCETTLCQFVSEPANTWSNLAYIIAALFIWMGAKKDNQHFIKQFSCVVFWVGAFSFIYHLSNNYVTQVFDFIGMFLLVFWCLGVNLTRLSMVKENAIKPIIIFGTIFFTGIVHWMYINDIKYQVLVLIVGIAIAITEMLAQRKVKTSIIYFNMSIILLIGAFAFSFMDHTRIFCEPDNHFIQGHALWHTIAGIAMYTIYRHYRLINLR
jgi:hypothetical protein